MTDANSAVDKKGGWYKTGDYAGYAWDAAMLAGSAAKAATRIAAVRRGSDWAELSGMLRDAARGKGNFGIGSATVEQAEAMGRAWVGEGFRVAKDGKTLVSSDGLRVFRPPSFKPGLGKWQANFERRVPGQLKGRP